MKHGTDCTVNFRAACIYALVEKDNSFSNDWSVKPSMERSRAWRLVTLLLAAHLTAQTVALPEVIKLGSYILYHYPDLINIVYVEKKLRETEIVKQ